MASSGPKRIDAARTVEELEQVGLDIRNDVWEAERGGGDPWARDQNLLAGLRVLYKSRLLTLRKPDDNVSGGP